MTATAPHKRGDSMISTSDEPQAWLITRGDQYWAVRRFKPSEMELPVDAVVIPLYASPEFKQSAVAAPLNGEYIKKADVLELLAPRTWDATTGHFTFAPSNIRALDRLLEN